MISYSADMRHFYINTIYPMASVLFHKAFLYSWHMNGPKLVVLYKYIDHRERVEGMRLSRCHIHGHFRSIYSVFFSIRLLSHHIGRT